MCIQVSQENSSLVDVFIDGFIEYLLTLPVEERKEAMVEVSKFVDLGNLRFIVFRTEFPYLCKVKT
mgnify:CR=1 FL=1